MRIINDTELNELLLEAISSKHHHWSATKYYLQDLYNTGCRSKELLDTSKWKVLPTVVQLTTSKTEAIRTFPKDLLSPIFIYSVENAVLPYDWLTYDQLTREFRKVMRIHPIWSGDRIADTYLYRYNRARLMMKESGNLLTVMDFFGWYSPTIASKYITTPLTYDPYKKEAL